MSVFVSPPAHVHPISWCLLELPDIQGLSPIIFAIDGPRREDWRRSTQVVSFEDLGVLVVAKTASGSLYQLDLDREDVKLSHPMLDKLKELTAVVVKSYEDLAER